MTLDDKARQLVDGRNFATIATLNPDGSPQTSVIWVGLDGDTVVFSTTASRRKTRNILRDPRVSLTVVDVTDPYRAVELRGKAEVSDDESLAVANQLSHKYLGVDKPAEPPSVRRVVVRVTVEKVTPST
jgi:PPOX class probable F420-dependent enzyme